MTYDRGNLIFRGHTGYLVEKGIFIFEEEFCLDINENYDCNFAVLGNMVFDGYLSSTIDVTYITFEKESYAVLKQWERFSDENHYYYEFKDTAKKPSWITFDECTLSELDRQVELREKKLKEIVVDIEPEAEELVQGLGYSNIELKFASPMFKEIPYTCYPAAYRIGYKLVLVDLDREYQLRKKKFDMRLMNLLVVRKLPEVRKNQLHEGYYPVIDKGNQIWQELLTKEMYEEYLCWDKNMQNDM